MISHRVSDAGAGATLRAAQQSLPPPRPHAPVGVPGTRPLQRILVAVDGSAASAGALRVASDLARLHGATIDVANVLYRWGPPPPMHEFVDIPRHVVDHRVARVVPADGRDPVSDSARWTIAAIDAENTALTIAELAEAERHELIVVPRRDGWADRWLRPSPGIAVARRAAVPVLAVPPHVEALPARAVVSVDGVPGDDTVVLAAARILRSTAALDVLRAGEPAPGAGRGRPAHAPWKADLIAISTADRGSALGGFRRRRMRRRLLRSSRGCVLLVAPHRP